METEQIMEMLKAMQGKADANQAEIKANRKADQEKADAGQVEIIAAIDKEMDALVANIKTACQYAIETSLKKMKPNLEEKETVLEQHDIPKEEVAVQSQEATKTEPDPGTMQSVEEHQEVPKEEAAVMPVGEPRKRRRDRNLAAGRRQKPKRRIQASCESRRRLNTAGKKMTRRATVAWRKRNIFRRIVDCERDW
jgi:hypothetical protein